MKNKKRMVFIPVLIFIIMCALGLGYRYNSKPLLTDRLENISKVVVKFRPLASPLIEKELSPDKDARNIEVIYNSIASTKSKYRSYNGEYTRNSEPRFSVQVFYKDGHDDFINSTETGSYIFRDMNDYKNFTGGDNYEIYKILERLFE